MLTRKQILHLFETLNSHLEKKGERGEVGIVGGAVMCLVYNARNSTQDVDAIFEPTATIRKAVREIADEQNLPPDWLNDAAKGYLAGTFERQEVLNLSHLFVWAPEPKYMLAMKCLSGRWDSHDKDDVLFLLKLLNLLDAKRVFKLIEHYYPKRVIPPKTQYFLEEAIGLLKKGSAK